MRKQERMLFALLRSELSQKELTRQEIKELFSGAEIEDWKNMTDLCVRHRVEPLVFEALQKNRIPAPKPVAQICGQSALRTSMRYYQMVALTAELLQLMEKHQIPCYLLKGAGLSFLYPKEETRVFGDIDLYIPEQDGFEKACQIIEDMGCRKEKDISGFHAVYEFVGNGAECELEIHWRLTIEFEEEFDRRWEEIYQNIGKMEKREFAKPMGITVPVLPDTMNAVYLLMHMLQHFMATGFGVRLFCDWTVFWNLRGEAVDTEQFLQWIHKLHLEVFLYVVTGICIRYFGLAAGQCRWMEGNALSEELMAEFLEDVLTGGEFGKSDKKRMLITTKKPGIKTNLQEIHRQMKKRFSRQSRYPILWPVLWFATGVIFLYNNKKLRKVSAKDILASNRERNRLLQQLDIFQTKT